MLFLAKYLGSGNQKAVIGAILMDLGFQSKARGYLYLKIAIQLFREDPAQLITYGVYVEVSKALKRSASKNQIEIGIRRSIKEAWKSRNQATWDKYFPNGVSNRDLGPSNAEFISAIADILDLWEGCCDGLRERRKEDDQNENEQSRCDKTV